jgi:hypothetical protein
VRAIATSRAILAGIAMLAAAGMTACSANGTPSGTGQVTVTTTIPATSASAAATQPATAPSATPSSASGIQNLVITSAGKSDLTAAYVANKGISLSDISGGGPTPGSVYYAYDPSTNTYWALADFQPSSTASQNVQVGFQDGGSYGMYQKAGSGSWQVQQPGFPPICGEAKFFPQAVLAAWLISTNPLPQACQ